MSWEFYGLPETDNCTRCLVTPARCFSGHLTMGSHIITAGWCRECASEEMLGSACSQYVALARAALEADGWQPTTRQIIDSTLMGWCGHWIPAMGLRLRGSPSQIPIVLDRLSRARTADDSYLTPREALLAHYAERPAPPLNPVQEPPR